MRLHGDYHGNQRKKSFNPFLDEERSASRKIWLTGEKRCLLLVDIKANCTARHNNIIFGKNLEMTKKRVLQKRGSDI